MLLTAFSVYYRDCPCPMYISMSRNPCKFKTQFSGRIRKHDHIIFQLVLFYMNYIHYVVTIAPFPTLLQLKDGGSMAVTELR